MVCLKCPFCFFDESKVVDSRSTDDNTTIRRRRECTSCGRRYTTYEKIEHLYVNALFTIILILSGQHQPCSIIVHLQLNQLTIIKSISVLF